MTDISAYDAAFQDFMDEIDAKYEASEYDGDDAAYGDDDDKYAMPESADDYEADLADWGTSDGFGNTAGRYDRYDPYNGVYVD